MADNEDKKISELAELLVKTDKDELAIVDFDTAETKKITSVNLITKLGFVDGFVVKYDTTTSVAIKSGEIEANGKVYNLSADDTHDMTSLASAFDHHYIYIDDSASTVPDAVIIDSITEPVFSDSKRYFYNGDDKCIGVIVSPSGSSTVAYFSTDIKSGNNIEYHIGEKDFPQMASDMNPTTGWLTPDENDGSIVTPVNAQSIFLKLRVLDAGAPCSGRATSEEMAAVNTSFLDGDIDFDGFNNAKSNGWVYLGESRNIKIAGTDNDDNA